MKKDKEVFKLSFSAILLSLAVVFELVCKVIPFLKMPNGGGISVAMLPLIMVAYVFGFKYALATGVAFGLLDCFLLDGYAFNIYSFILDYIVAFGAVCVASVFRKKVLEGSVLYFILGFVLAYFLRWIASGFSGVINANVWGYDEEFLASMFGSGKTGLAWLYFYSFIYYNLPYLAASLVASTVCGLAVKKVVFMNFVSENE